MKKAFTLIELLAVIVILAIILLIAYPLIDNIIDGVKRSGFESTVKNIIRAVETDYMEKKLTGNTDELEYIIESGVITSPDKFEYSGKLPNDGIIRIDTSGEIELALSNDDWCIQKDLGTKVLVTAELTVDGCDLISELGVVINSGLPYLLWQNNIASVPTPVTLPAENPGGSDFRYGAGTIVNPYLISTPADLAKINENPSAHFLQINDIDMSSYGLFTAIGVGTTPSDWDNAFTGSYDGNNFSINNITTTADGLFRHTLNATIENLKLSGTFGTQTYFGASSPGTLIGSMYGGTVNNVHVTGTMQLRKDETGGLIGYLDSSDGAVVISNSSADIVFESEYIANVSSVGGLIGYAHTMTNPMTITKSSANVTLEKATGATNAGIIGGLIGSTYSFSNNLTIEECFTTGNIYGTDTVGGFIGDIVISSPTLIRNSYSLIDIESEYDSGGFISYFAGGDTGLLTIENIYVSSISKAQEETEQYNVIPDFDGTITNSYYNYSKEGIAPSNNLGSGRAEEELWNVNTYDSWDFTNVWSFSKKPQIVEEVLPDKAFVLGSSGWDTFSSMVFVPGGFVAVGQPGTNDYDLLHQPSDIQTLIVKYNDYGDIIWSSGLSTNDYINGINIFARNDEYFVVGYSSGTTGDFASRTTTDDDAFVAKFSIDGKLLWTKNYGGSDSDSLNNSAIMSDGIVLVGRSYSTDSTLFDNNGGKDAIIIKVDFDGNVLWSKNYGGSYSDGFEPLTIKNNNIYLSGYSYSEDGDMAKFNGQVTPGTYYNFNVKYDSNGNILAEKAFSSYTTENEEEYFYNAAPADNGFIVIGDEWKDSQENMPLILLNFDENGSLLWKKTYGYNASGWAITKVGANYLASVNVSGNFVGEEFLGSNLIVKFDNQGNIVDYFEIGDDGFSIERIYYNNGYIYVVGRTGINEGIYAHPSPDTRNAFVYRYKY